MPFLLEPFFALALRAFIYKPFFLSGIENKMYLRIPNPSHNDPLPKPNPPVPPRSHYQSSNTLPHPALRFKLPRRPTCPFFFSRRVFSFPRKVFFPRTPIPTLSLRSPHRPKPRKNPSAFPPPLLPSPPLPLLPRKIELLRFHWFWEIALVAHFR